MNDDKKITVIGDGGTMELGAEPGECMLRKAKQAAKGDSSIQDAALAAGQPLLPEPQVH